MVLVRRQADGLQGSTRANSFEGCRELRKHSGFDGTQRHIQSVTLSKIKKMAGCAWKL
jgi:hypothetical protein